MKIKTTCFTVILTVCLLISIPISVMGETTSHDRIVIDSLGREVVIPSNIESVICSGAGALRYLTYLDAEDAIVGIDGMDAGSPIGRPYAMAHPEFQELPIIGDFKGFGHGTDNLEAIIALSPDVIIKTYETAEEVEVEQEKLQIPIIYLEYGDLGVNRETMYDSLRILGEVMGKEEKASEIISYIEGIITDLDARTSDSTVVDTPNVYIGGVNYYQTMGFDSTEPGYTPLVLVHGSNLASGLGTDHAMVSREQIIDWDPDVIFVDISGNGITDLIETDAYQALTAVEKDLVYGLLPYNAFTTNQETVLANAYYIGTILYPDTFADIDPVLKADEIFTHMVGMPVFEEMNNSYGGQGLQKILFNSVD